MTGVRWPGVARGVTLFALAGLFLRLFGTGVGTWTRGSLGPIATLLVGVVAPAWILVCFPTWCAWRIARPLGLRRAAGLLCWFSPLVAWRELPSLRAFLMVEGNRSFPRAEAIPADAWTALAAALQAGRQGNLARAARIREALRCLPPESPFPWLARCHGVEALMAQAWERQDWRSVLAFSALGRGRLVRWLARLAAAELGQRFPARTLWWEWACSPIRRRTLCAVRRLAAHARVVPKVTPAPAATRFSLDGTAVVVDVRLRHVSLLSVASRGERVSAGEVLSLAKAWSPHFEKAAVARFIARGLELEVRDASPLAQALRTMVVDDLILLASASDGELPVRSGDGAFVDELVAGLRERLCRQVETALARIDPEANTADTHPLQVWEDWLAVREALERLGKHDPVAAAALWNARVAPVVWNGTCAVFDRHGRRAAWVAHLMYSWVAEQAESMGDVRAMVMNRENARIVLLCA